MWSLHQRLRIFLTLFVIIAVNMVFQVKPCFSQDDGKLLYDIPFDTKSKWNTWMKGEGAEALFNFLDDNSGLSIVIQESTGIGSDITVGRGKIKLVKNQKYRVRLHLATNREGSVVSSCYELGGNWENYQNPQNAVIKIPSTGEQVVESTFQATKTVSTAHCTIGVGTLEPATEIILRQFQMYAIPE